MGKTAGELFMIFWLGYTMLMVGIIIAAVIWAKKTGQFSDQEHASRLPLEIEENGNVSNDAKS